MQGRKTVRHVRSANAPACLFIETNMSFIEIELSHLHFN